MGPKSRLHKGTPFNTHRFLPGTENPSTFVFDGTIYCRYFDEANNAWVYHFPDSNLAYFEADGYEYVGLREILPVFVSELKETICTGQIDPSSGIPFWSFRIEGHKLHALGEHSLQNKPIARGRSEENLLCLTGIASFVAAMNGTEHPARCNITPLFGTSSGQTARNANEYRVTGSVEDIEDATCAHHYYQIVRLRTPIGSEGISLPVIIDECIPRENSECTLPGRMALGQQITVDLSLQTKLYVL